MPRITYELLQKRAEHNEGMVSTLEEVALHQEDIEKIECIGQHARHLKIIYMQNNLIMKFENLHRLKELEYLNVALNNITKVENLQRCESLTKLDLTVNFIDKAGMLSLPSLQANEFLKELYLTGNPCADVEGYREFVVASIPQLKKLDGKDITHSERILAKQNLPAIQQRIEKELEIEGVDVDLAKRVEDAFNAPLDDDVDSNTVARPWSIETRIKDHREMRAERDKHEAQKKGNMDKLCGGDSKASKPRRSEMPPLPLDGERIWQKNEGEWEFTLLESEDQKSIVLDVAIGKYLDTSLVELDVQPKLVRMLVKGKLLQLELMEEVNPDKSNAQRATISGHLVVTMPKVREVLAPVAPELHTISTVASKKTPKNLRSVQIRGIVPGGESITPADIKEVAVTTVDDDESSDDEVPPLG